MINPSVPLHPIRHRNELWKILPQTGDLAEIGVAEGYFSRDMLAWPLSRKRRLYMVDRWKCVPDVKGDSAHPQEWHDKNKQAAIDRVSVPVFLDRFRILQMDSVDAAHEVSENSLALVYIDADHSYEGVMQDIQSWYANLIKGGVMAFHDYESMAYGVKQAVEEFCRRAHLQIQLLPEDRPEDAGAYFYVSS